jgi:hypothetical protein
MIAQHGNILATAQTFGAAIMALACAALLGRVLRARQAKQKGRLLRPFLS